MWWWKAFYGLSSSAVGEYSGELQVQSLDVIVICLKNG